MPSLDSVLHVSLNHYLVLSAILFSLGALGLLMRKNIIVILMSLELMLNAVNISFVAFSSYLKNADGKVMVFFIMTIAAAEAGVGLALAVNIFKNFRELNIRFFEHMKG